MSDSLSVEHVYGKGRGVIAKRSFKKHEIIEECPVIRLSPFDRLLIRFTNLRRYLYCYSEDMESEPAVIVGYGMMYNHSAEPNADFFAKRCRDLMVYYALCDIKAGEEITVDYGVNPWW